ncbi:MAG: hypothetical protein RR063_09845 [Anaerovoracaceae bacterium]
MLYCRFFKVEQGTDWTTLRKQSDLHDLKMKKTLPYKLIKTIILPQVEFNDLCKNIYRPHVSYKEFAKQSVAAIDGIWNCIALRGNNENRELIIYTAGQMYPLYAGVKEW